MSRNFCHIVSLFCFFFDLWPCLAFACFCWTSQASLLDKLLAYGTAWGAREAVAIYGLFYLAFRSLASRRGSRSLVRGTPGAMQHEQLDERESIERLAAAASRWTAQNYAPRLRRLKRAFPPPQSCETPPRWDEVARSTVLSRELFSRAENTVTYRDMQMPLWLMREVSFWWSTHGETLLVKMSGCVFTSGETPKRDRKTKCAEALLWHEWHEWHVHCRICTIKCTLKELGWVRHNLNQLDISSLQLPYLFVSNRAVCLALRPRLPKPIR